MKNTTRAALRRSVTSAAVTSTTITSVVLRAALRGAVPLAAASILVVPPAHAAQTGELAGVVLDGSGEPLSGVRVILQSPQMLGGTRELVSNENGEYRFGNLDPGSYTVTLSAADRIGYVERGIAIGIDSHVDREYVLEKAVASDGEKVIKVTATRPMVDVTRVSQGSSFTPELTDRTVTSRSYQGVALFTPGVTNGTVASGNPSIHGGAPVSNVYLLDGLNITDPVTQTFATNFNFDAIGELQVLTGGLDAEYGSTTGGVLNIVTQSGGDEFTLDGSVYWSSKELQLLDRGEINDSNTTTANLSVGGPIIKKKLWFFLSGQYIDAVTTTPVQNSPFGADYQLPPQRFNAFYGLGKLKWQVAPWQKVTVLMQGDPTWITNEVQSATTHADAERQRFQGGAKLVATSETTLSSNLFWKNQVGYGGDELNIYPMQCDGNFDTCANEAIPGHTNINPDLGTSTVNDSFLLNDRRYRLTAASSLSWFVENLLGNHEVKFGLEGSNVWTTSNQYVPGGRVFTDDGLVGGDPTGAGSPYQVTIYDDPLVKTVSANLVSLYVQDTWRPFKELTIRPGLRFDSSRGYNDVDDGGVEIFNFNNLSPRIGAAWDPLGDNKTVIRGGYFFYNETGLLTVPSFVGRSLSSRTFDYNPATEQYDIPGRIEGGANAVVFKPDMRAPNMHEVVVGVQRELFDNAALSVDFTWRRRQNMFEDDETNVLWNDRGDDKVGFRNNEERFIFSVGTPDDAAAQYLGMDVMFEKRLSDNWQALVTYTLSKSEGTGDDYVTYAFDNPRQRPFEYGALADDQRHRVRGTLSYDFPLGVQVGGTAIYETGRPLSKFFFNTFYGDYTDRRAPAGFDPKDVDNPDDNVELRTSDLIRLNTRIAWRLKEITTQDIWLICDISNVFNVRTTNDPNAYEQRDLPTFGTALTRGSPLNAELALRYVF